MVKEGSNGNGSKRKDTLGVAENCTKEGPGERRREAVIWRSKGGQDKIGEDRTGVGLLELSAQFMSSIHRPFVRIIMIAQNGHQRVDDLIYGAVHQAMAGVE